MKRDDTLDLTRWRAWSWGATPADLELAEKPPAPEPEPRAAPEEHSFPVTDAQRAAHRARVDDYAVKIEEAWRTRVNADVRTLVPIVCKAVDLLHFVALAQLHPAAAVHAARLLVSLWNDPKAREELDSAAFGLSFGRVQHPEVADLIIDVVRNGDHRLMFVISQMLGDDDLGALYPHLGARLGFEIESARSWRAREFALSVLAAGGWREGLPWLRKALRWPHLECRITAVDGLVALGEITADEVAWLVDDALTHPVDSPSQRESEHQYRYDRSLRDAVLHARPMSAVATLARIANGEGALIGSDRVFLAQGWALECIAHLDPTRARAIIDRSLREDHALSDGDLVDAVAALPEADARPRLLRLAAHATEYVARAARSAWEKRFGEPCPVDLFSGLSMELLDAPPSSEFEARVRVLKSKDKEARRAMMGVVLASPPSREALVLALVTMRLGAYGVEGAPSLDREWIAWLRERYGDLTFEALWLEARYEQATRKRFKKLSDLAAEGALPERYERLVREAVLADLDAGGDEPGILTLYDAMSFVSHDEVLARFEALLAKPVDARVAHTVVRAVQRRGPDEALDARLSARFFSARAVGDWPVVARYGSACVGRGVEAVTSACLDDVWSVDSPDASEALEELLSALHSAQRLTDELIFEGVADPHAPRFVRMAQYAPREPEMRARAVERLKAALAPDVPGSAAAEALWTLLRMQSVPVDDPRVEEVYERAPDEAKSRLLDRMIGQELRDARPWQPRIAALLLSADRDAASRTLDTVYLAHEAEWDDAWIDAMIAALPHGDARDTFVETFGRATDAETYWVSDDDERDEGDESGDETDAS